LQRDLRGTYSGEVMKELEDELNSH
jgi:hypothetical protein